MTESVVVDMGMYRVRVGLAGEEHPFASFRTLVRRLDGALELAESEAAGGTCPLDEEGNVVDVEGWAHVVREAYRALRHVDLGDRPLMVTDSVTTTARIVAARALVHQLRVPWFYIAPREVLALYTHGRTSGVVVHVGHVRTVCVAVDESRVLHVRVVHVGMRHVLAALRLFRTRASADTLRHCFVSPDVNVQLRASTSMEERALFVAPEVLFKPQMVTAPWPVVRLLLIGRMDAASVLFRVPRELVRLIVWHMHLEALYEPNQRGVVEAVHEVVAACGEPDLQRRLWGNLLLSGGGAALTGLALRLHDSLPRDAKWVELPSWVERLHEAPWIGGSILMSLSCAPFVVAREDFLKDESVLRSCW